MNALHRDLKKLVRFIENDTCSKKQTKKWRLGFHIMPPTGWLNDPNGLCYIKGEYHFFFQYSPFNPQGGLKFWGHYKSKDMIHWQYMEPAIFPDQPYDCHGAYSGCALVENDEMNIYYTGNVKFQGDYDYIRNGRGSNTIYIESKDGVHFTNKQCILTNEDYPHDLTCHVRDPKVFKQGDIYYMILGARTKQDVGEALLYTSENKINWRLSNRIQSDEKMGYMWECPDFFTVNCCHILSVSPQGMDAIGNLYQNVYQSGYFILTGEIAAKYQLGEFKEWDRGFDFYAPQTFEDQKGRRILVGWMGMPDCEQYTNPTVEYGWQHAFTLPREICVENKKVLQKPIEELKQLRKEKISFDTETTCISSFELFVENIADAHCCISIDNTIKMEYNENKKEFSLCFTAESGAGRKRRAVSLSHCHSIHVFVDYSSIELFINEGEEVFTSRYYSENTIIPVHISCENSKNTLWILDGFEIKT